MSLQNGDFQGAQTPDGTSGTFNPAGWNITEPADPFVRVQTVTGPDGDTGNQGLYMRDNKDLTGASLARQTTSDTIDADWETITFEFDVKGTGQEPLGQGDQKVTLELVNSAGTTVHTLISGPDNIQTFNKTAIGNDWQHFEQEFTVDPSWAGLGVKVTYYVNDAQNSGARENTSMLIDNVGISFDVPCFTHGTMIETQHGPVSVENLCSGDMVMTHDSGLQKILWIGSTKVSAGQLAATPKIKPIRICAGALGPNRPSSDLFVSPQHRMLIRSAIARRMFDTDEVLVAATNLLEIDGIDVVDDAPGVEYFHFMFSKHEIVVANGAETESLYAGPVALRSVGTESRQEILSLFPELETDSPDITPASARHLVGGRQGRQLAKRHHKNQQFLVC